MKNEKKFQILAIESSCDDTSAAIINHDGIQSLVTKTQIDHSEYGGVVPELASRNHMETITQVVDQAIVRSNIKKEHLSAIAITRGPGLMGSLVVGVSFGKGLAQALSIPLIEIHHMHAHILAHHIDAPEPTFPYLCLTVSGGHTQLVMVRNYHDMEILGETLDDAAGEAFDKCGKIMGLPYPAGPEIGKLSKSGVVTYEFPIAEVEGYHFSFSGLKTAFLRFLQARVKEKPLFIQENIHDICASIQYVIVETLIQKLEQAAIDLDITSIAIAGGVSANHRLRNRLEEVASLHGWSSFIPAFKYCTDNAAMIAQAAKYKFLNQDFVPLSITPNPRLNF